MLHSASREARTPYQVFKRITETRAGQIGVFVLFLVLLVAVWQVLYSLEIWPPYTLPSPGSVSETLWRNTENWRIPRAVGVSMRRLAIGYALSVAAGITIGSLTATSRLADSTVGKVVLGMQSLPSVAWLPLAVLWFGLNEQAIIFVAFMGSLFSVAISTNSGVKSIPPLLRQVGMTYGASRWQMYRHIIVPGMMPSLAGGLKLGWSFAWRSLMAGELLFAGLGLGQMLERGRDLNDMSLVLATMLVIISIGLVMDQLVFGRLEHWVLERRGLSSK